MNKKGETKMKSSFTFNNCSHLEENEQYFVRRGCAYLVGGEGYWSESDSTPDGFITLPIEDMSKSRLESLVRALNHGKRAYDNDTNIKPFLEQRLIEVKKYLSYFGSR
jgi:hypothetical protein